MARQIATPNYDTQCFLKIMRENKLETVLVEYPDDKFASKNIFKHSLGQIRIHNGINQKGEYLLEKNISNSITAKGLGESNPKYDNTNVSIKAKNRRVEIYFN